jgi:curli biogenesis system outer membrane secretion channel CsgG
LFKSKNQNFYFILFLFLIFSSFLISDAFAAKLKKTIAVSRFENKTSWSGQYRLDNGMTDQLTDALIQSKNFVVLERQTLGDVIAEQDLAASGRMAKAKAAATGKIVPSQILIKGTITEFESKSAGSGSGLSFGGFSIGSKKSTAHVAIILRIIDTTTGEVLDSVRVEGKAKSGGLKLGGHVGGFGFGTDGFNKTPLGKATQKVIDNAVVEISKKLTNIPYSGKIIKISGDTIYINAGARNGVTGGDTFNVFSVGEELLDPDTGESLGSESTKVGSLKVTSVQEKFSKGNIISGGSFEKGFSISQ